MQAWERFTVSTGIAIGEPGDLPALFGGNDTGLSEADLLNAGDLLPMDHPQRNEYINQGFRLVEVEVEPEVPYVITRLQYITALQIGGGLEIVFAAVEAKDVDDPVRIYFLETANFDRRDDRYIAMATDLGATEEDTLTTFATGATVDP